MLIRLALFLHNLVNRLLVLTVTVGSWMTHRDSGRKPESRTPYDLPTAIFHTKTAITLHYHRPLPPLLNLVSGLLATIREHIVRLLLLNGRDGRTGLHLSPGIETGLPWSVTAHWIAKPLGHQFGKGETRGSPRNLIINHLRLRDLTIKAHTADRRHKYLIDILTLAHRMLELTVGRSHPVILRRIHHLPVTIGHREGLLAQCADLVRRAVHLLRMMSDVPISDSVMIWIHPRFMVPNAIDGICLSHMIILPDLAALVTMVWEVRDLRAR